MEDGFVDYYSILRIESDVTKEEIERAYLLEVRYWHPDNYYGRAPHLAQEAEQRTRILNDAKEILTNSQTREFYDELYAEWMGILGGNNQDAATHAIPPVDPLTSGGVSGGAKEPPRVLVLEVNLGSPRKTKQKEEKSRFTVLLHRGKLEPPPPPTELTASIRVIQSESHFTLHIFVHKDKGSFPIPAEVGATFTTGGSIWKVPSTGTIPTDSKGPAKNEIPVQLVQLPGASMELFVTVGSFTFTVPVQLAMAN